jgi:dinuclear metal center YbgI/SA1388 family protein
MKLKDICFYLGSVVPVSFQESYDNSGLQYGDPESEINSALLSLDVTEEVVDEAIALGCNLIISHHPVIFKPLKTITGRTFVERIVIKAIKNDIAIYSCHTNLDAVESGVSVKMAEKLGLKDIRALAPLKDKILKLVTFVPGSHLEKVRDAIFDAGAGVIGNYDQCSFSTKGQGSFRGNEKTLPFVGEKGKIHFEEEIRLETILLSHLKEKVISALLESHPYEEVAYDIYSLENNYAKAGFGAIGELPVETKGDDFIKELSYVFNAKGIRYTAMPDKKIRTVALCGGAGIFLLDDSILSGADAFVTGDVKYHDFFGAGGKVLLVDIGHYESEKYSTEILYDLIIKKFPTFALRFSEINTNPINYL